MKPILDRYKSVKDPVLRERLIYEGKLLFCDASSFSAAIVLSIPESHFKEMLLDKALRNEIEMI